MKVKIGDQIFDANEEPIMIIFEDDQERISAGNQISNMADGGGIRKFVQFPTDTHVNDIVQFMKL